MINTGRSQNSACILRFVRDEFLVFAPSDLMLFVRVSHWSFFCSFFFSFSIAFFLSCLSSFTVCCELVLSNAFRIMAVVLQSERSL